MRFSMTPSDIRATAARVIAAVLLAGMLPSGLAAAGGKQLQRVRGTIGYSTVQTAADFTAVFGKFDLPDDDYAVTRAQSAAVLDMPDSSLVSLGENTTIQVGKFDSAAAGPGSVITLNNGSLRFDIRRPQGGQANYRFLTNTSTIGVRGTVGLLSVLNGVTTVGCLACAADSVTVTVGAQTFALATGQILTVSALGVVTTGALTTVVGTFSAAGVPVSAQAGVAAAGLPTAGIAGISTGTAITAGAAAAAGAAIGVAATQPSAKPIAVTVATPTPTPTATPAPGTGNGSVGLTGHPIPVPAPTATARAPLSAPPGGPPAGPSGRFGR
jgi:hypothetical protein